MYSKHSTTGKLRTMWWKIQTQMQLQECVCVFVCDLVHCSVRYFAFFQIHKRSTLTLGLEISLSAPATLSAN